MPNKTVFKDDWLQKKDCNGHDIKLWCEKLSKYQVLCRFCKKTIRCDNRGFSQLLAHSERKVHLSLMKDIVEGKQYTLSSQLSQNSKDLPSSSHPEVKITCWSAKNDVVKSEILWAMKVASNNLPYNSANDLNELFPVMFPDSKIASNFSMRSSKLSYLITEAVGPHFHETLVNDVKLSNNPFTLCFDELTNKEIKKQLDINIRYWSNACNKVVVHHLNTYLMSQTKGNDIAEKILKSIDNAKLPLQNLLTLGNDGPNVNKTVFSFISETKQIQDLPALLNIGTCNLHVVHRAFGSALPEFGKEVVDLVIDLHSFFKLSSVRVEELRNVQDEFGFINLKFLKHVECRWLTLGPALERVQKQWTVLCQYFLKELPKRDPKLPENARYQRIVKFLQSPNTTLVQVNFLLSIINSLEPFLTFFQREEPLIHLLYDYLYKIVRNMYSRFIKVHIIKEKSIEDLRGMKFPCMEFELADSELEIGVETRKVLINLKPENKKALLVLMRKFIFTLAKRLAEKLPLQNVIIKEARCLAPENRCKSWSVKSLKTLALSVQVVPSINIDSLVDEWKTLQCENIPEDWYIRKQEDKVIHLRVDDYYSKIFDLTDALGGKKYPEIMKLVKSVLTIPHGNADVERGFSQTSNFLTDSRTRLSEASINALQSTKDGLKKYGNSCYKVPITSEFITKSVNAHKSYLARLEEQKRVEKELQKKREREEKEKEELVQQEADIKAKSQQAKQTILKEKCLEKKESETNQDIDAYKSLVDEGNERIKNALKNRDMKGVQIGQAMLEAAYKKVNEKISTLQEIRNEQKEVEKTKRTMLDYFCSSQTKKTRKKL